MSIFIFTLEQEGKLCRPLEEGGLRIRNLKVFILSLLRKWRWKISNDRCSMWYRTLVNRYGIRDEFISVGGSDSLAMFKY